MQPDDTAWPILSGSFEPFRFRGQSGLGGVLERLGLRDSPRVHAPAAFDRKKRGVAIVNGHIIVPNTPRQSASSCRQRSCWPTKSLSEGGTRWPRRPPDDCFREAYLRCSASQRNTGGTGPHCSCNPLAAWSVLQPGRGSPSRCWFRLTVAHSERQQSQRRNSSHATKRHRLGPGDCARPRRVRGRQRSYRQVRRGNPGARSNFSLADDMRVGVSRRGFCLATSSCQPDRVSGLTWPGSKPPALRFQPLR